MANTATIIIKLIDQASKVFKKIGSSSKQMADSIRTHSSSVQSLGVQFAAMGVAGLAAFALVTKAAADSEEALRKTMTMTGLQGAAYNKMFKNLDSYASQLAVNFGVAGKIINEAFYQVLSTGARAGTKDFEALTETAIRLNKVVGLDLSDAVEQTAGTLNTFGLRLRDAGKMADVFFKASREGATTVPQLYEAMKQAGPLARAMGLSLEETTAILTHFANQNIKGAEAGTTFRRVLTRLTAPTKEAMEAMAMLGVKVFSGGQKMRDTSEIIKDFIKKAKTLKKTELISMMTAWGIETKKANGKLRNMRDMIIDLGRSMKKEGMTEEAIDQMKAWGIQTHISAGKLRPIPDILKDFKVSLNKLSQEEQAHAVKAVAGQFAMAGFLKAINSNIDQIPKLTKSLKDSKNALILAEIEMKKGFNETLKRMGQIANETFKVIGKVVTNYLVPYMAAIEKAGLAMLEWAKANPVIVKIAVAIAAAGTAIALFLGIVLTAVGTFGLFVASIMTAAPVLLIIGKALLVLTPIVAAVIAVVAALYLAWENNFLGIRDIVASVIGAIKNIWNGLLEFFNQIILPFFDLLREKFRKIWDAVVEVWDEAIKSILPILDEFWKEIQQTFDEMKPYLEDFWKRFKEGWHKILMFVSPIIDKMIEIFKKDLMKFIQDWLVPALIVGINAIKKAFKVLSWIAINIIFPFVDALVLTGKDIAKFVGIWHDNAKKGLNKIKKLLFDFKVWYDQEFAGMFSGSLFEGGYDLPGSKGKTTQVNDDSSKKSSSSSGIQTATADYKKLKEAITKTGESIVLLSSQQKGLNAAQNMGNLLQNALTTSSGEFVEAGEKVTAEIGSMVKGLTSANAGQDAWNRHLFNSVGIFDNSKKSLLDYGLEVDGLKEKIDLSKVATSLFNKSTEKAGEAVKYTYEQLDKCTVKFAGNEKSAKTATDAIVGFRVKTEELGEPLNQASKKLGEQKNKIVKLYDPLVTIGKTFTWLGKIIKSTMESTTVTMNNNITAMITNIEQLKTSITSMIVSIQEAIKAMVDLQTQSESTPTTGGEPGVSPTKKSIVSFSQSRNSMTASKTPATITLQVGTLVADDSGLRKLSDVLHKFNLERQGRRA